MKKRALRKEFWMEIKKSRNRFLSIFLIVALGVAFYSGVRATDPDMKLSADSFYDSTNLMDIRILSSLGLTEDDVEAIRQVNGVKEVMPSYFVDALYEAPEQEMVIHVMSNPDEINKIQVAEGRLPQNNTECLVDTKFLTDTGLKIGDQVELREDVEEDEDPSLKSHSFTIVGSGSTSYYLSLERGTSSIGSGSVSSFFVVPKDVFSMEVYPEVYATVKGAVDLDSYSKEYESTVQKVVEEIEYIADSRCDIRYNDIVTEGKQAIADGKKEISDGEQQLEEARQKIEDGQKELDLGVNELEEKQNELDDARNEIADHERTLEDGNSQIQKGYDELATSKIKLEDGKNQYKSGKAQIEEQSKLLDQAAAQIQEGKLALADARKELDDTTLELQNGKAHLEEQKQELELAKIELSQLQQIYHDQNQMLSDSKAVLSTTQAEFINNQKTLEALEEQLASGDTSVIEEIAKVKAQIEEQSKTLAGIQDQIATLEPVVSHLSSKVSEGSQTINQGEAAVLEFQDKLAQGEQALAEGEKQYVEETRRLEEAQKSYNTGKSQLDAEKNKLSSSAMDLSMAEEQISQGEATLKEKQIEWKDGQNQVTDAKDTIEEGEKKLADAREELEKGQQELNRGKEEYQQESEEHTPEIEEAKVKVEDAERDLEELEKPSWYVLDRQNIQTYTEYEEDSKRIGAIGEVFPAIFFIVAALVSLTTMTRMVEEERTQIGTLKALGYGKISIASKYILYALLASLLGSIFGLFIGQKIFPFVIIKAYRIIYENLPVTLTPIHLYYSISSTLLAVVCTVLATLLACYKELLGVPAELMRPAPPKVGKRVLLERMTFLWKRLSFTSKSTVRNLFRYKKRFFMTILGIGGCMALLLVGFGLKDSIMSIGILQFEQVRTYDSTLYLKSNATDEAKQNILKKVSEDDRIENSMLIDENTVDISFHGKQKSTLLVVPSTPEELSSFIKLRDRESQEPYELDDQGIIITEKLASLLNVKAGDTVLLKNDDMEQVEVVVSHVVENYFYHYTFLSPALYQRLYGEEPNYNQVLTDNSHTDDEFERNLQSDYLKEDAVTTVVLNSSVSERIGDMLGSMDTVIYVLVISAGLLAFIVLYNLNNINVSERMRELATLKVLGFYDVEVSTYVIRENLWLTAIGSMVGLVLGRFLHRFVVITAETDMTMFGRNIFFKSYVYSVLLTFVFSILVNMVMHVKLKKIDMVESMKSVE
ncbi:MAG TPA: ABC transporter permease [Candidatus Merdenecus merdavium]|nr:ABC transporter permease [Candidatus Merdenecus merdavium]